jgi:selT/selW/selH-like putative selenoprotein
VSKEIKKIIPNAQVQGNAKPPRSGAFEVTIEGQLIYSKFKTGNFPNKEEISSWF